VKCLRIYATPDGESPFYEGDMPATMRPIFLEQPPFQISPHYLASRLRFTRIPAGMTEVGWHTVPERVLTVRLDGSVEYGELEPPPSGQPTWHIVPAPPPDSSFHLVGCGYFAGDCRFPAMR